MISYFRNSILVLTIIFLIICPIIVAQSIPELNLPSNGSSGVPTTSNFTWNSFPEATSYIFQVSSSPEFWWSQINVNGLTTTSYQATGLYIQTPYYWRVGAVTSSGTVYSAVWSFTTGTSSSGGGGTTGPSLILPADNATDIPSTYTFSWNTLEGASSYTLQVSTVSSFTNNQVDVSGLTSTSHQVTGLYYDTDYYWRVGALTSSGTVYSDTRSFTTGLPGGGAGSTVPVLISPSNTSSGVPTGSSFVWSSIPGATYRIQIATSDYFGLNQIDVSNITDTNYTASGLYIETPYYWRVNATTSAGTSDWSTTFSFTTGTSSGGTAPQVPVLSSPANGEVDLAVNPTLQWSSVSGADSYGIQVSTGSSFTSFVVNQSGLTSTSYNVTGLNNGTTYYWRVNATNSNGTSGWSSIWSFTTEEEILPPLLTVNQPAQGTLTNNIQITVSGFVEDSTNTAKINTGSVTVNSDGTFSGNVSLTEGLNEIIITAYNSINDSAVVIRNVTLDTAPPVLTIASPTDSLLTNQTTINITGNASDGSLPAPGVVVIINGDTVVVDSNGDFSYTANLNEGINNISIIAEDEAGNTNAETLTVFRDTAVPILTITSPVDSLLTDSQIINVTGTVHDDNNLILTVYHAEGGQPADTVLVQQDSSFSKTLTLFNGYNNISVTATDAAGNSSTISRLIYFGSITIQILSPENNMITSADTVQVVGQVSDTTNVIAKINNVIVPLNELGIFSKTVSLTEGKNDIIFEVNYVLNNNYVDTITVFRDSTPPALTITQPTDSLITNQNSIDISGSVSDSNPLTLTINSDTTLVNTDDTFNKNITLVEGKNSFTIIAKDSLNNTSQIIRTVIKDTAPPIITMASPADGFNTEDSVITITGTVNDSTEISLTLNNNSIPVAPNGYFSSSVPLYEGDNNFIFSAVDQAGNTFTDTLHVTRIIVSIPPDPVASPVDSTVVTSIADATEFLYKGEEAVQQGVDTTKMEKRRIAVIKGKVLKKDGSPLPGAKVSVLDQPEFGYTSSRADGQFDIAVNGGGFITLDYTRIGYLPVQRQIKTPWQDYTNIDDVVMIGLDTAATKINFTQPIEVARGSVVSDSSGQRQATLMFKQGTIATMTLPDGSTQVLDSINVRATEYTVGDNGLKSMPAALPPASAYTYCVELSVDKAMESNAKTVTFNQPIPYYVDNFLGFPVGTIAPLGYYDRELGQWVPEKSGRVIKIVNIINNIAEIDINGDDVAEDSLALADTLGITQSEREKLAVLYTTGKSLWRVEIPHFSAWDINWGFGPPDDAIEPDVPSPFDNRISVNNCSQGGSIIGVQDQKLGERINITGTPFSLNYQSKRSKGYVHNWILDIPLTGVSIPSSAQSVKLEINIAGKKIIENFSPGTQLSYRFQWDGIDGYGRKTYGAQKVNTTISYQYPAYYNPVPRFGYNGNGSRIRGLRNPAVIYLFKNWKGLLTGPIEPTLGGWSISPHHNYDFGWKTLLKGDGSEVQSYDVSNIATIFAGTGTGGIGGVNIPAVNTKLYYPQSVEVGPDGNVYIGDGNNHRVLKVDDAGIVTLLVGAPIGTITDMAVGPDGSLYVADDTKRMIYKINTEGVLDTVAGSGSIYVSGDGGPAINAGLGNLSGIAVGPDGSIYLRSSYISIYNPSVEYIRKIDPSGIIDRFAGNGSRGIGPDSVDAKSTQFLNITDIETDNSGNVYICETSSNKIKKVSVDGILTTIAGNGASQHSGDGGDAINAGLAGPNGITIGEDGSIYIAENFSVNDYIRKIALDGIITTVAGNPQGKNEDGLPALETILSTPRDVAVAPNGDLYIVEYSGHKVRKLSSPFPGYSLTNYNIASEDGSEVYEFDKTGKHLKTIDPITGKDIYKFIYDGNGLLSQIIDRDSLVTNIERDITGKPTTIVSPFGDRTVLTLDNYGYISSITNPAVETYNFEYDSLGLMTQMTDPKNNNYLFTYDSLGLLIRDQNPAGGFTELSKTEFYNGYEVTTASAEGRIKKYKVEGTAAGTKLINTDEGGLETITINGKNGTSITTLPDETVVTETLGKDPRFGFVAPIVAKRTIATPGGITSVQTHDRIVTQMVGNEITGLKDTIIINGKGFSQLYDGNLHKYTNRSAEGRISQTFTDTLGRVIRSETAGIEPVTFSYNLQGFVSETAQGFRKTLFAYDTLGRLAAVTDPLNRTESYEYDAAGRITKQTLLNGKFILYSYDANGNLASITPPGKPAHNFIYNNVDLTESYTPPLLPDTTGTSYVYNFDKQLTHIIRPDKETVVFEYDTSGCGCSGVGKPKSILFDRGALNYEYSPISGYLSSVVTPENDTLLYTFDGSLPLSTQWKGNVKGKVSVTYNNDFQVTSQTINNSNIINYDYDNDGLLINAGNLLLKHSAQNGLLLGTNLGNVKDTLLYNSLGEATNYSAKYNNTDLFNTVYAYDSLGRITNIIETVEGNTDTTGYTYNSIGYLIEVKKNGTVTSQYEYDDNGNRVLFTGITDTLVGTYDSQDRMLSYGTANYVYTKNGDLRYKINGADTTKYSYDNFGNLTNVTLPNGTIIDYIIDGQNRRVAKKVNGSVTKKWLYQDQLNPVAELNESDSVIARFIYGSKVNVPDYIVKNDSTYKVVTDHLGSVRFVVNTTNGEIVQRIDYDEFGNIVSNVGTFFIPFTYAGGFYDENTRLVRFGARDYDASIGRWTNKDPILFSGAQSNLYEYAGNDPINYLDVYGLQRTIYGFGDNYWDRVGEQFERANDFVPGLLAPPLTSALTGLNSWLTNTTGLPNLGNWLGQALLNRSLPHGILNGVAMSRLATFGISAGVSATGWLIAGAAYETGLFIGSLISAYVWDYGNPISDPCK